ncbi:MAG: GrpB family protein, partial [Chlorobium sp.]|nr:GrpB family protein [Chlorobium sp.]
FDHEARRLQTLNSLAGIEIDHIGSTSIPGMVCKPIIDIMMSVSKVGELALVAEVLSANGYVNLGECGRPGRIFLVRGPRLCCATHHVHVVLKSSKYRGEHVQIQPHGVPL